MIAPLLAEERRVAANTIHRAYRAYRRSADKNRRATAECQLSDRYQPPVGGFGLDPRELYTSMLERERMGIDECR
jgi:hypothetical protein